MGSLSSGLKTWLRRNGFTGEGFPKRKDPIRASKGYVERDNRKFRIHESDGVVNIGEPIETFDRWANSTERTITIADFKQEFKTVRRKNVR